MTRRVVFAIAIGLGAVAVWLISTSTTQKALQLGVLAGLWGFLLGTFAVLGSRRQTQSLAVPPAGSEVELRTAVALLTALRAEVAQLHADLDEKLGGELRLERIETTRLFGPDLQDEVRKLKFAAEPAALTQVPSAVEARSPEPRHAATPTDTAAPADTDYHGRRRRPDHERAGSQDDLLTRLLNRESVR